MGPRRLGQKWSTLAVDMESAGVVSVATREHFPFAALRVNGRMRREYCY